MTLNDSCYKHAQTLLYIHYIQYVMSWCHVSLMHTPSSKVLQIFFFCGVFRVYATVLLLYMLLYSIVRLTK